MSDLEKLRELPQQRNAHDPMPAARDAFDEAFGRRPARATTVIHVGGGILARTAVPTLLAGLVGLYLLWAFAAAFTLGH